MSFVPKSDQGWRAGTFPQEVSNNFLARSKFRKCILPEFLERHSVPLVAGFEMAAPLEHHHAVVEVHGHGRFREIGDRHLLAGVVGIELIDERFAQLHKASLAAGPSAKLFPIGSLEIFDHVDAIGFRAGIKIPERRRNIRHPVAAVIEDDIGHPELFHDRAEKLGIRLIANAHGNLVLLKFSALFVDIEAHDLSERPEAALPELKGTAHAAPDLKEQNRPVNETRKMGFVGRKIVRPLVNGTPLVRQKFSPHRHLYRLPVFGACGAPCGSDHKPTVVRLRIA